MSNISLPPPHLYMSNISLPPPHLYMSNISLPPPHLYMSNISPPHPHLQALVPFSLRTYLIFLRALNLPLTQYISFYRFTYITSNIPVPNITFIPIYQTFHRDNLL